MSQDLFLKMFVAYIINRSLHGPNAKRVENAFLISTTIAATGSILSWAICAKDIIENEKYSISAISKNCAIASLTSFASCAFGIVFGIAALTQNNSRINSTRRLLP
jgi:hypothetical protein